MHNLHVSSPVACFCIFHKPIIVSKEKVYHFIFTFTYCYSSLRQTENSMNGYETYCFTKPKFYQPNDKKRKWFHQVQLSMKKYLRISFRRSVLRPLLFNIYFNDLFFVAYYTEVCNFADDTTYFACDKDIGSLINRLEHDSFLAIE